MTPVYNIVNGTDSTNVMVTAINKCGSGNATTENLNTFKTEYVIDCLECLRESIGVGKRTWPTIDATLEVLNNKLKAEAGELEWVINGG